MTFLSKLTLFGCGSLLTGILLSGCASTEQPWLSDNPAPPGPFATGSLTNSGGASAPSNDAPAATASPNVAATGDGAATALGNGTDNADTLPPDAARLQAGETVNISTSTGSDLVTGPIPTTPQSYLIADDGTISLPLIGTVQAAGKTPGELQRIITKLYVPAYFVRLAVTVTAQTRVYYVGGEVMHPGPEAYLGQTTVTKAIQAAGDFTQFASHKVWLTRAPPDGTRIHVDVNKALRDPSSDPSVFPGDQIEVPRRYF